MKQTLEEYCDWLEDLTESGDTINSKGLQKWITEYVKEQQTKQLPIHGVSVTLPNIEEINKVLKNQIENLEYAEKLDGYEIVAYRRGFTFCLKWLGNKLTKGN